MRLLDRLFPARLERRLAVIAGEIARLCQPEAGQLIGDRLDRMNLAEARGFIRARSRAIVAGVAAMAVEAAVVAKLVDLAIERLTVSLIAEQLKRAPVAPRYRRAA